MSNWQPPKILTDAQKVEIAKTEERFGNKSGCDKHLSEHYILTAIILYYIFLFTFFLSELVVITGCSSGLGRETGRLK